MRKSVSLALVLLLGAATLAHFIHDGFSDVLYLLLGYALLSAPMPRLLQEKSRAPAIPRRPTRERNAPRIGRSPSRESDAGVRGLASWPALKRQAVSRSLSPAAALSVHPLRRLHPRALPNSDALVIVGIRGESYARHRVQQKGRLL